MIINLLMILALAIGAGSGQSIERGSATAETDTDHRAVDECYRNGIWYNPCPSDPAPDQPGDGPQVLIPQ